MSAKSITKIIRTGSVFVVAMAAFTLVHAVQAEGRTNEPDSCAQHGSVYMGHAFAPEELVDERVGHSNWVVGGHYLLGQDYTGDGHVLQFWIQIKSANGDGTYHIIEYYYLPHCSLSPGVGQVRDILVAEYVNPVLEDGESTRSIGLTTEVEQTVNTDQPGDEQDDDEDYPPDPIDPPDGGSQSDPGEGDDDDDDDDGGSIYVATTNPDDLILEEIPIPQIP